MHDQHGLHGGQGVMGTGGCGVGRSVCDSWSWDEHCRFALHLLELQRLIATTGSSKTSCLIFAGGQNGAVCIGLRLVL